MSVIDKLEQDIFKDTSQYSYEGLPFVGNKPPIVKKGDPDKIKPKLNYKPSARTFNMADKEDVKAFEEIWDRKLNGNVIIGVEDRHYEPVNKNWLIFMRWSELYYTKGIK